MKTIRKKISLIVSIAIVMTMSMNISLFAQKDKGNVITQERKLADFNAIELGNALNVILSQGEVQSIKVETNEGLQEFIKTEVDNGVLKITQSNKMKNPTKLIVYVTVKNINKITLTGASELKSETPIKSDKLELNSSGASEITLDLAVNELESNFSGASDITLNGTATTHNILISGASDLKAGGLVTQETTLNASVASDIEVNVKKN